MNNVILHAFNWRFSEIADAAPEIARLGYGAVLFPPPLFSDECGTEWWQRYQPRDYRVIRSALGNKAQLQAAIAALQQEGVRCYADVVFNHMANEFGVRDDALDFPGRALQARYAHEADEFEQDRLYGDLREPLFDERSFHPRAGIDDWFDADEVADGWLGGLPDLSLTVWVIKQQLACLQSLNGLGFDGYRVDAIKHMAEQHINLVFRHPILAGKFVFGEILTFNDRENQTYLWPAIDESSMSFYDFPLQQTLHDALSVTGSLQSLANPTSHRGALPWHRAVTFSVTHDVPNNESFRGMMFAPHDEYLANVYVLGRDGGVPMIYSDHGESTLSHPDDAYRWQDLWRRADLAAMLAFHNALHGAAERLLYVNAVVLVLARGARGMVAINKSADWQTAPLAAHGLQLGTYVCQLHGHHLTITGEAQQLQIPPRQAQMWLFASS